MSLLKNFLKITAPLITAGLIAAGTIFPDSALAQEAVEKEAKKGPNLTGSTYMSPYFTAGDVTNENPISFRRL